MEPDGIHQKKRAINFSARENKTIMKKYKFKPKQDISAIELAKIIELMNVEIPQNVYDMLELSGTNRHFAEVEQTIQSRDVQ